MIQRIELENALLNNPVAISLKVNDKVIGQIIDENLESGNLIELTRGQYYRKGEVCAAAAA